MGEFQSASLKREERLSARKRGKLSYEMGEKKRERKGRKLEAIAAT